MGDELVRVIGTALNYMTTDEILAQLLAVQLGVDPRTKIGYEKVASFYEPDGITMRVDVRDIFIRLGLQKVDIKGL